MFILYAFVWMYFHTISYFVCMDKLYNRVLSWRHSLVFHIWGTCMSDYIIMPSMTQCRLCQAVRTAWLGIVRCSKPFQKTMHTESLCHLCNHPLRWAAFAGSKEQRSSSWLVVPLAISQSNEGEAALLRWLYSTVVFGRQSSPMRSLPLSIHWDGTDGRLYPEMPPQRHVTHS